MYSQNLALAQTNRTLSILRAIDLLIIEASRDLSKLSEDVAQAIIDASAYALVTIYALNEHSMDYLQFQGLAHNFADNHEGLQLSRLELVKKLHIPIVGEWVESKRRNLILDLQNDEELKEVALFDVDSRKVLDMLTKEYGLKALYFTKLKARDTLTGVMMVGIKDGIPKIDDIELIERVSEPAGIALDNRLLYEENIRVVNQLQKTNARLKEIDASKDEFISMASHQLRTPLTSMKGYVSMILDGDVGPVSDAQRTMLEQAFDSSQRMVYLIADLLNVSRLRTGKFVLSTKETDTVQLVEDEIKQLLSSAKARGVTLQFNKPKSMPKVYIDDTKIRQVVMNFLDNALYYTPSGGHITVDLGSNDTSLWYTVTDTGLGVPKEEQKNLFTKFYRAQNAQKMRPDGTGLGLYMARKVIVAHGGAILFQSEQGKGSTFGFKFPLDRLREPVGPTIPVKKAASSPLANEPNIPTLPEPTPTATTK
jgi:signal transduction histidine kinase